LPQQFFLSAARQPELIDPDDSLYFYSEALRLLEPEAPNAANHAKAEKALRLACPSAAKRRAISSDIPTWLSLPQLLSRWQMLPVRHIGRHTEDSIDLSQASLVVSVVDTTPIRMLEACELALAALALDWQVELLLSADTAEQLHREKADAFSKPFGSLAVFGISAAWCSDVPGELDPSQYVLPVRHADLNTQQRLLSHPAIFVI
jgi:hypothetical protein